MKYSQIIKVNVLYKNCKVLILQPKRLSKVAFIATSYCGSGNKSCLSFITKKTDCGVMNFSHKTMS